MLFSLRTAALGQWPSQKNLAQPEVPGEARVRSFVKKAKKS